MILAVATRSESSFFLTTVERSYQNQDIGQGVKLTISNHCLLCNGCTNAKFLDKLVNRLLLYKIDYKRKLLG